MSSVDSEIVLEASDGSFFFFLWALVLMSRGSEKDRQREREEHYGCCDEEEGVTRFGHGGLSFSDCYFDSVLVLRPDNAFFFLVKILM